ncbi:NUDIX domain-containing protein, partial [Staphylococcus ureilyticus]|nr:NUDIX domain-containing protein [Staphylococcus ureilyticus]
MIKCVCLVVESDDKLLLVQARNRNKYYFPGGKIDSGESLKQALRRELQEELQLDISEETFTYMGKIVGDAYPQKDKKT